LIDWKTEKEDRLCFGKIFIGGGGKHSSREEEVIPLGVKVCHRKGGRSLLNCIATRIREGSGFTFEEGGDLNPVGNTQSHSRKKEEK